MKPKERAGIKNLLTSLSSDLSVSCWKLLLAKPSWKSESLLIEFTSSKCQGREEGHQKYSVDLEGQTENTHSTRQLDTQVWSSKEMYGPVRNNWYIGGN